MELGKLEKLVELRLEWNPLAWPGPEVVKQGTKAVLAYLRGHPEGPTGEEIGKYATSQQEVEAESVEQKIEVAPEVEEHRGTGTAEKKEMSQEEVLAIIEQAAKDGRTALDLSGMGLAKLPEEIGQLTSLRELYLYHNQLKELPGEIGKLTSLEVLKLYDNQVTALAVEIGQLTRLEVLYLDKNRLTELPVEIGQLTSLKELDLSYNQLTALPGEIGQLTSLTEFWLGGNRLVALPGEIEKLKNLENLWLNDNRLTALPREIGQLTRLTRLDLDDNRLTALPVELGRLEKLETLVLNGNPLESPPMEVVRQGTKAVLAYLREQLGENAERKNGVDMERAASVMGDKVAVEDKLGRKELVGALAEMFIHTKDVAGFTVALLGDWGAGKSTVMQLLEEELKGKDFEFAKFNAWQYEHTDNIAAGLAQEVVRGLIGDDKDKKISCWERQKLRWQFGYREYRWSLLCCVVCLVIAGVLPVLAWPAAKCVNLDGFFQVFFGVSAAAILVPLAIYTYKGIKRVVEHPLAVQMKTYLNLPSYGKHLGLIPVLKRHIETLCDLRLTKRRRRLLVFVDDLDRCQSECIARTLDAIRLVMEIENVIVLIGIDHRIAFRAIEEHYYREIDVNKDGNDKIRTGAEIARDYLGKIFHLPVKLLPAKDMSEYINDKLFADAVEPEKKPVVRDVEAGEVDLDVVVEDKIKDIPTTEGERLTMGEGIDMEEEASAKVVAEPVIEFGDMKETTDERGRFAKLAELFAFDNPRKLLRLRNSYRLLKVLNGKDGYGWESLMEMLFWQEFLHNWSREARNGCMAVLIDEVHIEKAKPKARGVLENVRDDIVKIFSDQKYYKELAEFVRIVVLPHSEEGIFDSKEEINEWISEKEKEVEEIERGIEHGLRG